MVYPFPIVVMGSHPLELREVLHSCLLYKKNVVLKVQTAQILDTG